MTKKELELFKKARWFVERTCPHLDAHEVEYVAHKVFNNMRFVLDDDETRHLSSSRKNTQRLSDAVNNIEAGRVIKRDV